jgi:citrate lyase subunit beta/citryl-CoA lyase
MTAPLPTGPAWMFCPADRPERYGKAADAADVVIIDLEDGVAAPDKEAARTALIETPLDPARTVVRVSPVGTADHGPDVVALARTQYRRVMLAKSESAADAAALADYEVVALIETPRGALAAAELAAAANVIGLMWGAEDLVAALGGNASRKPDGTYYDVARHIAANTLLAAKAHDKFALDAVYLDLGDTDGLRAETEAAVAVGFDGKVALHPRQVPVIRAAYAPSPDELAWAQAVLAEAPKHRGAFAYAGKMVDMPLLRHADRIVRRSLL